ncbi:DUF2798 domain-containing protein [Bacillus sp. MRMR6]|uniref:DUF2798 domain-containing protein n=1 Tax=Bacillus sp. MRMR6 TaxID=1928617 RepID=UPI000951780E|nr:DUF2798 domain-containing protein [Bacillus sp. MRMR6]OLS40078.1 DUF2798 domain-containing protein [Bacillus sp. MRMR6]
MPTTRKESLQFGLMMCFGMVFVMTFYNLILNGAIGSMKLTTVLGELMIGFILALGLDIIIVGPVAKKIVFTLPIDKSKKFIVILAMSTCMVVGMAFFMSFFGLAISYLHNGVQGDSFLVKYLTTFGMNFIVALPMQLLVMGPLVRLLFIKFVVNNKTSVAI